MPAPDIASGGLSPRAARRVRGAALPRLLSAPLLCLLGAAGVALPLGGSAGVSPQTQPKPAAAKDKTTPGGQLAALREKAEKGDAEAQYGLAVALRTGKGAARNDGEAVKWYRAAADQGHAGAQNNLGWMYSSGYGVPQDDAQAVNWFRKAADQGEPDSQYNLGMMYLTARGVRRDDAEAVGWFRKAADQGDAGAQFSLGVMYERGLGVTRDDVEAHVWYELASTRSSGEAQKKYAAARDQIAAKLTAAQIADANKRLKARTDAFGQRQTKAALPTSSPEPCR